jgi:GNAT superfamily N-acetyltransferase
MTLPGELFPIHGYRIRLIDQSEVVFLQRLLEQCTDYCLLVDGHPPRPSAASALITDRPEGKTIADKVDIGVYSLDHEMIGVLDAIRDYPEQGAWWIGLLLIAPDHRNNQVGRRLVRAFEKWALQQGARRILLGVVEANHRAFRFWQMMGYTEINRQPPTLFGNLSHIVIKMGHELARVDSD